MVILLLVPEGSCIMNTQTLMNSPVIAPRILEQKQSRQLCIHEEVISYVRTKSMIWVIFKEKH